MLLSGHREHAHPCLAPGLGSAKAKPKSSSLPGWVQQAAKQTWGVTTARAELPWVQAKDGESSWGAHTGALLAQHPQAIAAS